ncbi:N-acetylglucosamine-specific PTS transporter subunit IIBC [Edaphosphingomonas haloaromaticamans]|uniref:PTS system glucoside-specific EIICBA component n=1 Tax=Edaphosphingomonas haloaromaticamans TaxID=653954 RepID=A0A1S1HEW9_9SPHN|nr:N-acetylglucosamine-specific PTS transporter subunit IIBC [Sphingomonas haloaromaticamans]OHT20667.1 PTS system glucoside-specific EIICBA component [Sphingomonas haloaromaticamans]
MKLRIDALQPLGRALMLPVAVLPVAGLLLRLGQPDLLNLPFIAAAGDAIFANLGLLFAAGIAIGLARENHGAAGLAGVVCFLVTMEGAKSLLAVPADATAAFTDPAARDLAAAAWKAKELARLSVPAGILSGLASGWLYNRYSNIKLPEYLAFFGGRRFVPIAAGCAGLVGAALFGLGFPWIAGAIARLSEWVVGAGSVGLFIYGALNRLLIITGLHHILNNIAWFILGDFHGATGDLKRFFAGDPAAGAFMSGFFPVMMFGLPAACLAMYRTALPERRKAVGGMLLSLALTSFLTGVTEPIEFSFIFLAPLLYALHAVLTGVAMVVMDLLDVRLGFGFSAGLIDYLLNFGLATRPLMLLPVGAAYFAIYYAAFTWCIRRFDLKTPGRDIASAPAQVAEGDPAADRASGYIAALGGAANLRTVDACTTRLRLVLADNRAADEAALKALGARGVLRLDGGSLQVVLGPVADQVAGEIRGRLAMPHAAAAPAAMAPPPAPAPAPTNASAPHPALAADLLPLLGGAGNIRAADAKAGRVRVTVAEEALVDLPGIARITGRPAARVAPGRLHLICPQGAEAGMLAGISPISA